MTIQDYLNQGTIKLINQTVPTPPAAPIETSAMVDGMAGGSSSPAVSGTNATGLDAAAAGSVDHVNPTGSMQNCTNCVYSVNNQLQTGAMSSALPRSSPMPFNQLEGAFNTQLSDWTTQADLETALINNGEGTSAIVYGMDQSGTTAHVWNAVVQNGSVNYIDGQIGGSGAGNFNYFPYIKYGILQ